MKHSGLVLLCHFSALGWKPGSMLSAEECLTRAAELDRRAVQSPDGADEAFAFLATGWRVVARMARQPEEWVAKRQPAG